MAQKEKKQQPGHSPNNISFTEWERNQIYNLLSTSGVNNAPLAIISDMLKAREALDPSNKKEPNLTTEQLKTIREIAMNPDLRWPIDERSLELNKKLQSIGE